MAGAEPRGASVGPCRARSTEKDEPGCSPKGRAWASPQVPGFSFDHLPSPPEVATPPRSPGTQGVRCAHQQPGSPSPAWHCTWKVKLRPWCFPGPWRTLCRKQAVQLPPATWRGPCCGALFPLSPSASTALALPASQGQGTASGSVCPQPASVAEGPLPSCCLLGAQMGRLRLTSVPQGKSSEPGRRPLLTWVP